MQKTRASYPRGKKVSPEKNPGGHTRGTGSEEGILKKTRKIPLRVMLIKDQRGPVGICRPVSILQEKTIKVG